MGAASQYVTGALNSLYSDAESPPDGMTSGGFASRMGTIVEQAIAIYLSNSDISGSTHRVTDPEVGWLASKLAEWTADSFSGGMTVDFSSVAPSGASAVLVNVTQAGTASYVYTRPYEEVPDPEEEYHISNTPNASGEYSCRILNSSVTTAQVWVFLASGTAQFAVTSTATDLYISHPIAYMY